MGDSSLVEIETLWVAFASLMIKLGGAYTKRLAPPLLAAITAEVDDHKVTRLSMYDTTLNRRTCSLTSKTLPLVQSPPCTQVALSRIHRTPEIRCKIQANHCRGHCGQDCRPSVGEHERTKWYPQTDFLSLFLIL